MKGQKNISYSNPVIFADYSDPDVIRVKDTYYMTSSSFNFTPGLPLLMSKDLVRWNLVGYACENIPFEHFNSPLHSKGIWAPSLRYHDGKFIIVVGLPDEGLFVTEAESFTGSWSPLRCIWKGKGFIDPCPFWDFDGKAWIIHAYAKSRIGFNSRLGILRADSLTLECSGEDELLFNGEVTQPTIEGPKVYFYDGFYYILAPAGGVKQGWQTALRAKTIMGPYEEKVLLHQGLSHINGPHQGALVDTCDGKWKFIHFQDRGVYGRVTLVQNADWKDHWPLLGTSVQIGVFPGEPEDCVIPAENSSDELLPGEKASPLSDEKSFKDDFSLGKIPLSWQWQANHRDDFILREDFLILRSLKSCASLWDYPAVLTEKIVFESFTADFTVDVSSLKCGERFGIIFQGSQYASIGIEHEKNGEWKLFYLESSSCQDKNRRCDCEKDSFAVRNFNPKLPLHFFIDFQADDLCMEDVAAHRADSKKPSSGSSSFSVRGEKINWIPCVPPFKTLGDHWTGGRIGMYALCFGMKDSENKNGHEEIGGAKIISVEVFKK